MITKAALPASIGRRLARLVPGCFRQIGQLYGSSLPIRGNHPRDLLQRLVDVASARGVSPELNTELIDAAWRTLFVAT